MKANDIIQFYKMNKAINIYSLALKIRPHKDNVETVSLYQAHRISNHSTDYLSMASQFNSIPNPGLSGSNNSIIFFDHFLFFPRMVTGLPI